jgi:hypothetical protein
MPAPPAAPGELNGTHHEQSIRLAGRPRREEGHLHQLSDNAYAYTAEGDPNTGVVIGDESVMVIDTQATPVMAQDVIRRIREVTDKPSSTSS